MPYSLSDSERPLLVATFTGTVTDAEYQTYLAECEAALFSQLAPYALVYDGLLASSISERTRELQLAWTNRHRYRIESLCRGVAFVLGDSLQRGMLAAAHLISPPFYPHQIFSTRQDGIAWCRAQLGAAHQGTSQQGTSHQGMNQVSSRQKSTNHHTPVSGVRASPGRIAARPLSLRPERQSGPTQENSLHPTRAGAAGPGGYSLQSRDATVRKSAGLPRVLSATARKLSKKK